MMFKMLRNGVMRKGIITTKYPRERIVPFDGDKGLPVVSASRCNFCAACAMACPTGAIQIIEQIVELDIGACIFCGACERACDQEALKMSPLVELATKKREGLRMRY
jgi:formate hydrogenlyase subunit 6